MRISYSILLPLLACVLYNEAVVFKFTNFVCENHAETLLVVEECRLRAVSREKNTFNFNVTLLHSINSGRIDWQIFKKTASLSYQPWLYSSSVDGCRFVNRPYNPIAIIVYRLVKQFSNLNHPCPYEGSVYLKGFYLRFNMLPHAIPTGEYLLGLTWVFSNTSKLITNAYFAFQEDF